MRVKVCVYVRCSDVMLVVVVLIKGACVTFNVYVLECLMQRSRLYLLGGHTMMASSIAGVCITDVGGEDVLAVLKALWAFR